jgi:hypothetical protein
MVDGCNSRTNIHFSHSKPKPKNDIKHLVIKKICTIIVSKDIFLFEEIIVFDLSITARSYQCFTTK